MQLALFNHVDNLPQGVGPNDKREASRELKIHLGPPERPHPHHSQRSC